VSQQEFEEVQAKLRIAEAEVNRAERMLQSLIAKRGQVGAKTEQANADVTSAQVNVGYSRVTAPMNGVVTSRQAEVGLLASPGVPLLTVEDSSHYRLEVSVEDSMLKRIRLASPALVFIDAIGVQGFPCKVTEIVPASDPGSRSSTVKIDLMDGKGNLLGPALRSGFFGKARFPIGQKDTLLIPSVSMTQNGQLTSVFTVDTSNIVHMRLIKPGKQYDNRLEVLSGLNSGDRIVVEGMDKVKEGDRVE
jgi:membrane fusion protein, multidrug efflux system